MLAMEFDNVGTVCEELEGDIDVRAYEVDVSDLSPGESGSYFNVHEFHPFEVREVG